MPEPPRDGELEELLDYVNQRRLFDFRGYKRASLSRRIFKRMQTVGVGTYQQYVEVLEANPGEFAELFNTILINVTSLRRDPEAWDLLSETVIPSIIQRTGPDDPIRIWSAGCASGEEAYTLGIAFAEALGEERFRRTVKIYATDADSEALVTARHGRYREEDVVAAFGEERARQYFETEGGSSEFRADLRRALIFGRHDLVSDPPISRIDLVSCRNTLMYFTADVQFNVLGSLFFALNNGGYLFLGKAEALVTRSPLFQTVDLRQRIFRKDGSQGETPPLASLAPLRRRRAANADSGRLTEMAFENSAIAQVIIDNSSMIVLANREARRMLSIGTAEVGRNLREAELALRPIDLQTPVEAAVRQRQPVSMHDVLWDSPRDGPTALDIVVTPMEAQGSVTIAFRDVSRYQHLRDELEQSQRELESAYEELQSTVEELETTNEELQSTNEELETTNEELHSANEELETMNEELQSTNDELEAINNELRDRSAEVDDLNQFLQSILGSLSSAVIVLGTEMDVRAWNRQAEELWGLRSEEVMGQHFLNLDIGFPVDRLRMAIRDTLSGKDEQQELLEPAVNRRGRQVNVDVKIGRLQANEHESRGVIVLMDAQPIEQQSLTEAAGAAPPDGEDPR